uniref:LAS1 like ribosome biogenesis factor n=1 Tax=Monopterus albus TaxID=43700 RepID=A0A3Q3IRM4_MONAL|nr:ribosomal biogenesis protein LAS1L-like [Monopterus albus]
MKKKSAEKKRHVVAWSNKAEWDQVQEYLYSKDSALQRYAVQRISAWKARYANSTLVAVDSTADLVRCQVLDRSGQLDGDDLVLLYGAALVRFVNLITERQQGRIARPLRRLAGDELIARQKEMEAYKNARELLISFEKEQYQVFDGLPEDKETNLWPSPFVDMSWLLGEIKQFASESSDLLIDVLLEDGFLVPTVEQLDALGCDTSVNTSSTEPKLPQTFLHFWLPLLKLLNSPLFIHHLLEKLFVELKLLTKDTNNHRAFYLSAWISEVILCNNNKFEYHFETKAQKKARMKGRIFVNRIQLRWQQLLSACLDAPCVTTPHLLQLILNDMEHPLPGETQQKLLQLCSIYTQTSHSVSGPSQEQNQQPIYTLESLLEKRKHSPCHSHHWHSTADQERNKSSQDYNWADVQAEKAQQLKGSPWQVCADKVLWKNYPLGKVPGQSDDPSCFMVEHYSTMTVSDQPVETEGNTTHNIPGASASMRTAEGLIWNHSYVNKLKSGLKLF